MKRWITAGLVLAMSAGAGAQSIEVNKGNRTLSVTATDSASALADLAVVHVGFEAYGADEQAAYAAGSQRSNAIMQALLQAGVAKDAIESENQGLEPLQPYEIQNNAKALQGMRFKLTQSWTVRTRPDDAAKTLDVAVKAGANQSGAIDWQMLDDSALESQAAAKALTHARAIADRMAAGMQAKVGVLLYASNQVQAPPMRPMIKGAMLMSKAAPAPLAISTRKIERSSTVTAIFSIE